MATLYQGSYFVLSKNYLPESKYYLFFSIFHILQSVANYSTVDKYDCWVPDSNSESDV